MNFLQKQLENPVRLARIKRGFYIGLAMAALAEIVRPLVFSGHDSHFWFEDIPAWSSLFGLISTVVIIVVSKFLGKIWLMKREEYYE